MVACVDRLNVWWLIVCLVYLAVGWVFVDRLIAWLVGVFDGSVFVCSIELCFVDLSFGWLVGLLKCGMGWFVSRLSG